jgi:hopene-associated glycosyltransferase HpnB
VFFFQMLYPFRKVAETRSRVAAAAGGVILLRRTALARIGGIEAISGALIDDVALAGRVKRSGGRIWLGHATLARSVRPYPAAVDVWRMVARTAYVQLRFSPAMLLLTIVGMAIVWFVPLAATLFGTGAARAVGLAGLVLSLGSFLPTLRRFRLSPLWAAALPAIALFYVAATVGSAVDHHRGRGVVWKQRAYGGEGTI